MAAGLIGAELGNQKCSAGVAFNAKLAGLQTNFKHFKFHCVHLN
jgi:hypothetical protein